MWIEKYASWDVDGPMFYRKSYSMKWNDRLYVESMLPVLKRQLRTSIST
jgi:hypothetical protein